MFLRNWARLYSNLTRAEAMLEPFVAALGTPYRCQHPFFGLRCVADFVLMDDKVIIEVDGLSHSPPAAQFKDLTRSLELARRGWRTVRITNDEVFDSPARALELAFERLSPFPDPGALEKDLERLVQEHPSVVLPRTKRGGRGPKPAPKKAPSSRSKRARTGAK